MRLLFIPPNNWATHPNPMRHHFLFGRLAKTHRCKIYVLNFDGLGKSRPCINPGLAFDQGIELVGGHSLPVESPALYYVLNSKHFWDVIKRALASLRIDVVVNSNILPGAIASILADRMSVPVVFDFMEYYPQSASAYYKNSLARRLVRYVVEKTVKYNIHKSDVIITVCDSHAQMVRRIDPTKPVYVVPNGVDLELFRSIRERSRIGEVKSNTRELRLVYVGSIDEWLDMESVLQAIHTTNSHTRISLRIVGGSHGGHYLDRIRSLVRAYGLENQIVFTGFVSYHVAASYIESADVGLAPYRMLLKNDGTPLKILEYLACGKIVLATRLPEFVKRFGSLLHFYDSPEDLVRLLEQLSFNRDVMEERVGRADEVIEQYSWDRLADSYYRIIESTVADGT